jgi:lysozyme
MDMNRFPAALAAVLTLSGFAAASTPDFAGMEGLQAQLAGVRAATQAQKAIPQKEPLKRVMGASRSQPFKAEDFTADAVPDPTFYQVRGVDISHYQLDIDWNKVRFDQLSFVYIKATEGADGVDEKFAANWQGAQSAGLARGAYHFYNFCRTGAEQAAQFIRTVPVEADALPATIDLEESPDCKTMPSKAAFRKDLAVLTAQIQATYGRLPVMYVNYAIYDMYFAGMNDPYKFWIADVSHATPEMPDNAAWAVWQYGWHGHVDGIPGEVDLDAFNGTPQMLADLSGPSPIVVASAR